MPGYAIAEGADGLDGDRDLIAAFECEIVAGHDAGSGHQERAVGKAIVAEEKIDQLLRIAFEFVERGTAGEGTGIAAAISMEMAVDFASGSGDSKTQGPSAQLPS